MPNEFWVNVYRYETVKGVYFYSHHISYVELARNYQKSRETNRTDCKCVYRIHVKLRDATRSKLD